MEYYLLLLLETTPGSEVILKKELKLHMQNVTKRPINSPTLYT